MRTMKLLPLLSALLLLALLAACAPASTPAPTEVPPTPTALEMPTAVPPTAEPPTAAPTQPPAAAPANGEVTGAALYQLSCASCHGADRKGVTFDLDGQKIDVPELSWDTLSATFQTQPARGDLNTQIGLAITKGLDETGADLNAMMPRWSSLSQAQVDSLVQYLQNADTTTGQAPAPADLQGEQLYQAACAACHGADAAGITFDKDGNKIETPSLHWSELTSTYSADPSRGTVEAQVALGITKGLDETGGDLNAMMPRWSSLSQAQVDSLVKYLETTYP